MSAPGRLRIARASLGETIQDCGRYGYLRYGVVASGPIDWIAHAIANRALGNSTDAASIEVSMAGIEVICEDASVYVAFAGGAFIWQRDGMPLPNAAVVMLRPGEKLTARTGSWGSWTYLASAGGIDVPHVLGSRSTYARFAIGGLEGRALRAGDVLATLTSAQPAQREGAISSALLARPSAPVRVILGPQDDYFTRNAIDRFFSSEYTVSPRFDRMGYWLEGPQLAHADGYDIVSDGITIGAIQVPGSGQPLVLMADHQATGGYPKIGTVIRADIAAFGQRRPGERVRFAACDAGAARSALLEILSALEEPPALGMREDVLHASNLIGGVVDGVD